MCDIVEPTVWFHWVCQVHCTVYTGLVVLYYNLVASPKQNASQHAIYTIAIVQSTMPEYSVVGFQVQRIWFKFLMVLLQDNFYNNYVLLFSNQLMVTQNKVQKSDIDCSFGIGEQEDKYQSYTLILLIFSQFKLK